MTARIPAVQMSLHLAAAGLATGCGYLARWASHASGLPVAEGVRSDLLELLVPGAVVGGLASVVLQIVALLVPGTPLWWERLLAQCAGVVASSLPVGLVVLSGVFTMGSLLPQIGNLMALAVLLVLAAGIAGTIHFERSRPVQARTPRPGPTQHRPILLLAGSSALVVSFFSAWWLVNGAMLVLTLLGFETAGAG